MFPQVSVANSTPSKRIPRKPAHSWHLRSLPFQLQPCMIAPVLAGETMKNLLMQSRIVTDPVKNPLIGWWAEYYFFYVKLRDLMDDAGFANVTDIENMLLDLSFDAQAALGDTTPNIRMYHNGGINWVEKCLNRISKEYFRDEGENGMDHLIQTLPIAQISGETWLDSVFAQSEMPEEDVDVTPGTPDTVSVSDFDALYQKWMIMRAQKMTEMDFEEYLGTFGVSSAQAQRDKPELIRYIREWTYPTNTIDPVDGTPTSALSWSVSERADKDRFFTEPGFIVGISLVRPKVYMGNQRESASHLFKDAKTWLPAMLNSLPQSSLLRVPQTEGPLGGVYTTEDYWVDVRDVLTYGDQFVNFDLSTETGNGQVALPGPGGSTDKRYVTLTDIQSLFVDTAKTLVRQDGVCNLNILGRQIDHT